ncbi:MRN complex-interacting protein-like [Liolophura sinensis]|uniref:MRN complex-interacting protein-like n=1 Tax=Liolophura sinensis TaxID=3198878 RepID=UPI0031585503
MPQEFQVLRCYSCDTFQVHQVKKAKKWNCKVCGEKQSLIKVFGQGTGAECRRHTQKLNMVQGEAREWGTVQQEEGHKAGAQTCEESVKQDDYDFMDPEIQESSRSRWSLYLDAEVEEDELDTKTGDDMYTTDWREYRSSKKSFRNEKCESKMQRKRQRTTDYKETHRSYEKTDFEGSSTIRKGDAEDNIPRSYPLRAQLHERFGVRSGRNLFPGGSGVHTLREACTNSAQTEDMSGYHHDKPVKNVLQRPEIGSDRKKNLPKPVASMANNQQSKWGKFLAPEAGDSDSSEEQNGNYVEKAKTVILNINSYKHTEVETLQEHSPDLHSDNQENIPLFEASSENGTFANNINFSEQRDHRKGCFPSVGHIRSREPPGIDSVSGKRTCSDVVIPDSSCSTLPVARNPTGNSASIFSLGETSDDDDFTFNI